MDSILEIPDRARPLPAQYLAIVQEEHYWSKAVGLLSDEYRQQLDFSADKLTSL